MDDPRPVCYVYCMTGSPPASGARPAFGYTATEVARLLALPPSRIHSWVRAGFVEPRRGARNELRFSFPDLVVLRAAKTLADQVPPRRVLRALQRVRRQLPQGRGLAGIRFSVEGGDIVVHHGGVAWEPESGQARLDFDAAPATGTAALSPRVPAAPAAEPAELDAEAWFERGCETEAGDAAQARDAYRRALELDPGYFDARVNLGRLLHEAGEVAAAEANYRLALGARPGDATASFNLGVALEDLRRPAEAVQAYEKALDADPDYADAHYNLAHLHELLGRPRNALRHLQQYRQLVNDGGA